MEPGDGWYRHLTNPCVGAIEFEFETTDIDAAGRVQRRTVAGRTYDYQQDAMGRLTAYTDYQNTANSATYSYDYRSRRVAMTVGGITTRFVYDGDDVVAEFVDEDADNQPDRMRYYWNLPGIDQRIGFVDVDVDTGAASYYYYLTDQIGSVIAVVNADGDIVNRYDYDAFGNLRRGTSWETVPNRYRFQGREYDAHRGDYYFRLRTYIPEWGMFTGPDFKLAPSDPNGACNYLFASNNPLMFRDPTGLRIRIMPPAGGPPGSEKVLNTLTAKLYQLLEDIKAKRSGTERLSTLIALFAESKTLDLRIQIAFGKKEADSSDFSAKNGGPIYLYLSLPTNFDPDAPPKYPGLNIDRMAPLLGHELVHVVETIAEHPDVFEKLLANPTVQKIIKIRNRVLRRFSTKQDKSISTSETDQWTVPRQKAIRLLGFYVPYSRPVEGMRDLLVPADFLGYFLWGKATTDIHKLPANPKALHLSERGVGL